MILIDFKFVFVGKKIVRLFKVFLCIEIGKIWRVFNFISFFYFCMFFLCEGVFSYEILYNK